MHIAYTPELEALSSELKAYFRDLLAELPTGDVESLRAGRAREIVRRIGTDGWLGIGWPEEFGGQGRSAAEQFVFFDEAKRAGVPLPMLALNTVGPTIMRYGTPEQKQRHLPPILSGDADYAVGYTEPDAGTDLASLKTAAVRDGETYVINGRKIFTSGGDAADFIWLAARTDPMAPKHRGLSIFIVPTTTPGFTWSPFPTAAEGGTRTNTTRGTVATFFDDVVVPAANRIGPENAGWELITRQLNQERVVLAAAGGWAVELAADVRRWCAQAPAPGGGVLIDLPWVQLTLARVDARLQVMTLFNWRMVSRSGPGQEPAPGDASAANVFGTETLIEVCKLMLEVVGCAGCLVEGSPGAVLSGRLEHAYRAVVVGTFGGGNNDIQREMIATRALGMARASR
ncbi:MULTISPECIES: acyl-CoA dehydrogenase family protein [unclassified Phenylobacterium]|uniref:acyl-CoA dehydrogenase family protein n=1 Tax=unclassified Phenylobacterium TaxID=2640670 RepID=UPI001A31AAE0|nr:MULTISPECIES: acyl-CoA dehydrogenase family protein [unclassified Phenylobacterium]MBJ7412062.1 acyl-CoA dehydrogenase family protein [Phenylobacterium sp.]MCR5879848.1 acyl-CoA dehydrogenase family protein [Phenylobacterium sp. J367]